MYNFEINVCQHRIDFQLTNQIALRQYAFKNYHKYL